MAAAARTVLLLLLVALAVPSATAATNQGDIDALDYMRSMASTWPGGLGLWTTDPSPCDADVWQGITCEGDRVTQVDVSSHSIVFDVGNPLDAIAQLTALKKFFIGSNTLVHPLPRDMCSDTGGSTLEELDITSCGVTGTLPDEWAHCDELWRVSLGSNALTGTLPKAWAGMEALSSIDVQDNTLTGEAFPDEWLTMGIVSYRASNNAFSGALPAGLGRVTTLTDFSCESCGLSGDLPKSLGNVASLVEVALSSNAITGELWDPQGHSGFQRLRMAANQLTGEIPPALFTTATLEVDLSDNQLSGTLPAIAGSSTLATLRVEGNDGLVIDWSVDGTGFWEGASVPGTLSLVKTSGWTNRALCSVPTCQAADCGGASKADTNCHCPDGFVDDASCNTCLDGYFGASCEPCPGVAEGAEECWQDNAACSDTSGGDGSCPDVVAEVKPHTFDPLESEHRVTVVPNVPTLFSASTVITFTTAADCTGVPPGPTGTLDTDTITMTGRFSVNAAAQQRVCVSLANGDAGTFLEQGGASFQLHPRPRAMARPALDAPYERYLALEFFDDSSAPASVDKFGDKQGTVRVDTEELNAMWGSGGPDYGTIGTDHFSVRVSGWMEVTHAEEATFKITCDGGVRMWVDDVLVIDSWADAATSSQHVASPVVDFGAYSIGDMLPVVIHYYHATGNDARLELRWSTTTTITSDEFVPMSMFYQPFGYGLPFDGSSDLMLLGHGSELFPDPQAGAPLLWHFHVRPHLVTSTDGVLVSYTDDTDVLFEIALNHGSGERGISVAVHGAPVYTGVSLPPNSWSLLSVLVDFGVGQIELWVDGVVVYERVHDFPALTGLWPSATGVQMAIGQRLNAVSPSTSVDPAGALDADLALVALEEGHDVWAPADRMCRDDTLLMGGDGTLSFYYLFDSDVWTGHADSQQPAIAPDTAPALERVGTAQVVPVRPPAMHRQRSLRVNGYEGYTLEVENPIGFDLRQGFTVAAWVAPKEYANGGESVVLSFGQRTLNAPGMTLKLKFAFTSTQVIVSYDATSKSFPHSVDLGEWSHIACVVDVAGDDVQCYMNGAGDTPLSLDTAPTLGANGPYVDEVLQLGGEFASFGGKEPDTAFRGSLDDVKVWTRPLSAPEVIASMCNHAVAPESLVALYNFQGCVLSEQMLHDLSGHGNSLQLRHKVELNFDAPAEADVVCSPGYDLGPALWLRHERPHPVLSRPQPGTFDKFTLAFWLSMGQTTPGSQTLLAYSPTGHDDAGFRLYVSGNAMSLTINNVAGACTAALPALEAYGAGAGWHHWIIMWDEAGSQKCVVTLDGSDITGANTAFASGESIAAAVDGKGVFAVGGTAQGAPSEYALNARMDEVRFWADHVFALLDTDTVEAIACAPDSLIDPPTLSYRFDAPNGAVNGDSVLPAPMVLREHADMESLYVLADTSVHHRALVPDGEVSGACMEFGMSGCALALARGHETVFMAYNPTNMYTSGEFTFAAWIYPLELGTDKTLLHYVDGDDSGGNPHFRIDLTTSGGIKVYLDAQTSAELAIGVVAGEWQHVAIRWSTTGNAWEGWRNANGPPTHATTWTQGGAAPSGSGNEFIAIGHRLHTMGSFRSPAFTDAHFVGFMDEVRLWSVAVGDAVIAEAACANGALSETGLVAAWDFDECSPQNGFSDRSTNNNHLAAIDHKAGGNDEVVASLALQVGKRGAVRSTNFRQVQQAFRCHDAPCSGGDGATCCPIAFGEHDDDVCGKGGTCAAHGRCWCHTCMQGERCASGVEECLTGVLEDVLPETILDAESPEAVRQRVHFALVDEPIPTAVEEVVSVLPLPALGAVACNADMVQSKLSETLTPVVSDGNLLAARAINLDDDPLIDVVYVSQEATFDPVIYVLRHDTPGVFSESKTLASPTSAQFLHMAVGDVNGDSSSDLVVSWGTDNKIRAYLGTGDATTFGGTEWICASGVTANKVLLWDLQIDGYDDVLYLDAAGDVQRLRNDDGAGTFSTGVITTAHVVSDFAVADFQRTGRALVAAIRNNNDVVLLEPTGQDYSSLVEWDALNTFGVSTVDASSRLEVTDVDRDGALDILVMQPGVPVFEWLFNVNQPARDGIHFDVHNAESSAYTRCFGARVGNSYSNDEFPTGALCYEGSTDADLWAVEPPEWDITSGWSRGTFTTRTGEPEWIAMGDLDGNGLDDVLVASPDAGAVWVRYGVFHVLNMAESTTTLRSVVDTHGVPMRQTPSLGTGSMDEWAVCLSTDGGETWAVQKTALTGVVPTAMVRHLDESRPLRTTAPTFTDKTEGVLHGPLGSTGNAERTISFVPAGDACIPTVQPAASAVDTIASTSVPSFDLLYTLDLDMNGWTDVLAVETSTKKVHVYSQSASGWRDSEVAITQGSISTLYPLHMEEDDTWVSLVSGTAGVFKYHHGRGGVGVVEEVSGSADHVRTFRHGRFVTNADAFAVTADLNRILVFESPDLGGGNELFSGAVTALRPKFAVGNLDDSLVAECVVYGDNSELRVLSESDPFDVYATWSVTIVGTLGSDLDDVAVGDVDGDGAADIVTVDASTAGLRWFRNDGSLSFSAKPAIDAGTISATSLSLLDIDLDGDLDVVVGESTGFSITYYANNGDGSGWAKTGMSDSAPWAGGSSLSMAATTIDAHGAPMVVAKVDTALEAVHTIADNSLVGGVGETTVPLFPQAGTVLPDVNNAVYDMCMTADLGYTWHKQDDVSLFIRDEATTVSAVSPVSIESGVTEEVSLTGGHVDGRTKFVFVHPLDTCPDTVTELHATVPDDTLFTTKGKPTVLATGLINSDVDVDVVGVSDGQDGLWWGESDGLGGFTKHEINAWMPAVDSLVVVDLDNDGNTDDLLYSSLQTGEVGWFRGESDATSFVWTRLFTVLEAQIGPSAVAADEFTSGETSIVIAAHKGVYVLINDGFEAFDTLTQLGSLDCAHGSLATIELFWPSKDTGKDIVAACPRSGAVVVYDGDGIGGFTEFYLDDDFPGVSKIAAIDAENDLGMDVVAISETTHKVVWYRDMNGYFERHDIDGAIRRPYGLAIIDVNDDGFNDVVVAAEEPALRWYRNDGSDASIDPPVGWAPYDGDVDGGTVAMLTSTGDAALIPVLLDSGELVNMVGRVPTPTTYSADPSEMAEPIVVGHNTEMDLCYSEDNGVTYQKQTLAVAMAVAAVHGGNAAVFGDPHFGGFHGGWFDFHGTPGDVYNLVSDTHVQLNARFVRIDEGALTGDYMAEFGLKLGATRVLFRRDGTVHITPLVEDSTYAGDGRRALLDGGSGGDIVWNRQNFTVRYDVYRIDLRRFAGKHAHEADNVATHHVAYRIWFDRARLEREGRWQSWSPHGVHGQTSRVDGVVVGRGSQGEGVIEGTPEDYRVRSGDLFGDDFAFNQFRGGVPTPQRVAVHASPADVFAASPSAYGV